MISRIGSKGCAVFERANLRTITYGDAESVVDAGVGLRKESFGLKLLLFVERRLSWLGLLVLEVCFEDMKPSVDARFGTSRESLRSDKDFNLKESYSPGTQ